MKIRVDGDLLGVALALAVFWLVGAIALGLGSLIWIVLVLSLLTFVGALAAG